MSIYTIFYESLFSEAGFTRPTVSPRKKEVTPGKKTAADDAKAKGLKSVGFGRWVDKSGNYVADTDSKTNTLKFRPKDTQVPAGQAQSPASQKDAAKMSGETDPGAVALDTQKQKAAAPEPAAKEKKVKTLAPSILPGESATFKELLEEPNKKFFATHTKHLIAKPFEFSPAARKVMSNGKFPRRYMDIIERMASCKMDQSTKKWGFFTRQKGGAGATPAQAGELLAMMGSTMNDSDADMFYKELHAYVDAALKKNPKAKPLLDPSWIKAGKNQREATQRFLKKKYGDAVTVSAACWDTEADVTALGLPDYKKNKGFSTDMYLRVKREDGGEVLEEVSLKKSTQVNFLNSGTSSFSEWDSSIKGTELDTTVYSEGQAKQLAVFAIKNKKAFEKLATMKNSRLAMVMREKYPGKKFSDVYTMFTTTPNKAGSHRTICKLFLAGAMDMARVPLNSKERAKTPAPDFLKNPAAAKLAASFYTGHQRRSNDYATLAINAINTNPKLKTGIIQSIRSEFPLKSVSDGEETMAIGPYSMDKYVMKEIFGTDDYSIIKEKLYADPGPPPFIAYKATAGDRVIPIAEIKVREDGTGYGGQFKFEMTLHDGFAKALKEGNKAVYGYEAPTRSKKTQ